MFKRLILVSLFISVLSTSLASVCDQLQNKESSVYGPVLTTDSLWRIADHYAPRPCATVSQAAVAIFAANQRAFLHHNVNGLMAGYTLEIPSPATMMNIPRNVAYVTLRTQNKAWYASTQQQPSTMLFPTELLQAQHKISEEIKQTSTQLAEEVRHLREQHDELSSQIEVLGSQNQQLKEVISAQTGFIEALEQSAKQESQSFQNVIGQRQLDELAQERFDVKRFLLIILLFASVITIILFIRLFGMMRRLKEQRGQFSNEDVDTISGDNSIDTELDLAKAYCEMGRAKEARRLLKKVKQLGSETQRQQAKQLLDQMSHD